VLSLAAQLNEHADAMAGEYRYLITNQGYHPRARPFYGERLIPIINTERIVRNQGDCLRLSLSWPRLLTHWFQKRTSTMDLNQLDYRVLEKAMKSLPPDRRRWLTKHTARFAPVGYNMVRRKEWHSPLCPRCQELEDHSHVWRCKHPDAVTLRERQLGKLDEWLTATDTDPDLRCLILTRLFDWLDNRAYTPIAASQTLYSDLLLQQDAIGWELPFTGMWLNSWAPAQEVYYRTIGSSKTGRKWLERLTVKIWKIAWDLWRQRCEWLSIRQQAHGHETIVAKIQLLYRQPRRNYPPSLRRRMIPLAQLLERTTPQLEAWYVAFQTYASRGFCRCDTPLQNLRRLGRSLGVTTYLPSGVPYHQAWNTLSNILHQRCPTPVSRTP
jgi:hypothetical protein